MKTALGRQFCAAEVHELPLHGMSLVCVHCGEHMLTGRRIQALPVDDGSACSILVHKATDGDMQHMRMLRGGLIVGCVLLNIGLFYGIWRLITWAWLSIGAG